MESYSRTVNFSGVPAHGDPPGRFEMVASFDPKGLIKGTLTFRRRGDSDSVVSAHVGSSGLAEMTEVLLDLMEDILDVEESR